jgi:hypothetical protein|tara:strand:+ start:3353 stop:3712 length:360 start_codon:yes stop_codon:yes gene_type:complete
MPAATLKLGPFDQYDSQVLELTVKEGTPLATRDISGDALIFKVGRTNVLKKSVTGASEISILSPQTGATKGRANIIIDAGDFAVHPRGYDYEIVLKTASTRDTILQGVLTVDKSIITDV